VLTYLSCWADQFSPLNLFRYVTFRAFMAAGTSFLLSLALGRPFIGWLRRHRIGQHERTGEEMQSIAHGAKEGTPTMGGGLILATASAAILLWGDWSNAPLWIVLATFLAMGGVGFLDDWLKWKRKDTGGLAEWQKLALQGVWMLVAFALIRDIPSLREHSQELMVPFSKVAVCTMPLAVTFLFFFFVLVGTTNALNLTDGLDGLAAGCMAPAAGTYAVFAYAAGHATLAAYLQIPAIPGAHELAIVCSAAMGACIGFLWWNAYPARVFMGDTGSQALGGLLAMVAILVKQELALLIVGGVFLAEAGSVMLQRGFYKLTRRLTGTPRRIFRMAPLHHHFEIIAKEEATQAGRDSRSAENAVVVRFWIVSIAAALVGLATLKIR
jgi:phospho-N-acetylmuramoyl-pentapeptide-transferase